MRGANKLAPWAVLITLSCGGTVVIDGEPTQAAGSSSSSGGGGEDGIGGAEAYCQAKCEKVHELGGIQCPTVEECLIECTDPYREAELLGCLSQFMAIWDCITTGLVDHPWCPINCADEYGALALCQNPDQK